MNGYTIRPVNSRFGCLYQVGGTGLSFARKDMAGAYTRRLPSLG